jgi:hypothetical protein
VAESKKLAHYPHSIGGRISTSDIEQVAGPPLTDPHQAAVDPPQPFTISKTATSMQRGAVGSCGELFTLPGAK